MKTAQVNKLYSKLTPHEQAALTFEAAARRDESEIDAIIANVPRQTYQGVHADYKQRATGLYMLVGEYGLNYWQARAALLMVLNLSRGDESMDCADMSLHLLAKIASMDAALTDVCRQIKVDVEAVKMMAGCENQPTFSQYADAELTGLYTEIFAIA